MDAPGKLWVRGPHVMSGYLNRPEETGKTIMPDGWLRTGDVASIDGDGHLPAAPKRRRRVEVCETGRAIRYLGAICVSPPSKSWNRDL